MDSHFNTSTCISYLTEKLRQAEFDNGLIVQSSNGQDVIILEDEFNDSIYYTYIYSYNGYLKEQFTLKDNPFDPSAGQNIMSVKDFKVVPLADNLYQISLTDKNNQLICINIHIQ